MGLGSTPSVPFQSTAQYQKAKLAFRQLGTRPFHSFLNRKGSGMGTVHVLFPYKAIQTPGSRNACLLYSFDPNQKHEIGLGVFGHQEVFFSNPGKHNFFYIVRSHSEDRNFTPQGRVSLYSTDLSVDKGFYSARETTHIDFTPNEGVSALRLHFTPRLQVSSVSGPGGEELPFLQWQHLKNNPNLDLNLIVDTSHLLPNQPTKIRVEASGSLFEPIWDFHHLLVQTNWYPSLDDYRGSPFELFFNVPRGYTAVGAGNLLGLEEEGKETRYHFHSDKSIQDSTIYFGNFVNRKLETSEVDVELFVNKRNIFETKAMEMVLNQVADQVEFFGGLFRPLELKTLRVVSVSSILHESFEGLIPMTWLTLSEQHSIWDRAHLVAHQWWGNMVQPKDYPDDLWLSESFAEYSAMAYFRVRSGSPEKTKRSIHLRWVKPIMEEPFRHYKYLTGLKTGERPLADPTLLEGRKNLKMKGPAVLNMLRYLFILEYGGDKKFWALFRDFLNRYHYQPAGTADFIALAEKHYGGDLDWFWNQWIYGKGIPRVHWTQSIRQTGDRWEVKIQAEQRETDFTLMIPVYFHLKGGKTISHPIEIKGSESEKTFLLREEPEKITLNDYYEALVKLKP